MASSHPPVAGEVFPPPPTIWGQSPRCVMNYFSDIRSAKKKENIGRRYSLSFSINLNWRACFKELEDVWLIFSLSLYQLLYNLFRRPFRRSRENMTLLIFSMSVSSPFPSVGSVYPTHLSAGSAAKVVFQNHKFFLNLPKCEHVPNDYEIMEESSFFSPK